MPAPRHATHHSGDTSGKLVARTRESSSIAQLDGSDIVYVARVAVPKLVTLAVSIGTRFPALQTSLGKVLLAEALYRAWTVTVNHPYHRE